MATVRIGGVTFNAGSGESGFFIDLGGFKGWDAGADFRHDTVPRPQAHGNFDTPGFLDERIVSITGKCHATSADQLDWFSSQLTGLLGDGSAGQITVDLAGKTTWATGRLAVKTEFDVEIWGALASYQISLRCPNPRKFGDAKTFASSIPAYHHGNFPATPVFTVTGSMPGYSINGPAGKVFSVTTPVTSGHPHTIDMATGILTIDGAQVFGAVSSGDTWAIPGGAQVTSTLVPTSGTGTLAVAVTDTYL